MHKKPAATGSGTLEQSKNHYILGAQIDATIGKTFFLHEMNIAHEHKQHKINVHAFQQVQLGKVLMDQAFPLTEVNGL